MIVGLDLDNTISDMPWLFSILSKGLMAEGHEVHVITFRDDDDEKRAETEEELKESGISYTALHLAPNNISAEDWKAAMATALKLDVMFEDSPENLHAMPEDVKTVWLCDRSLFNLAAVFDRNNRKRLFH